MLQGPMTPLPSHLSLHLKLVHLCWDLNVIGQLLVSHLLRMTKMNTDEWERETRGMVWYAPASPLWMGLNEREVDQGKGADVRKHAQA